MPMRFFWLMLLLAPLAQAQVPLRILAPTGTDAFEESGSILSNAVTNLHTQGDSVWAGPFLNMTFDGGQTWLVPDADSLFGTRNRTFSIDIEGPVIWVGLGFVDVSEDGNPQSAGGFLVSTDGGETFTYRQPQLDAASDDEEVYGVNTLAALPVIVPQQSPPFDIDYDPVREAVWVAGWASGIRRSEDGGLTWQRVVLPPDDLEAIHPDSTYDFTVEPQRGGMGELNHMGFGILVDETGTIWAGTPKGVNRSADGLAWQRFSADGTPDRLTGSWVISIEEEPLDDPATPANERNPVWMATWNAGEVGDLGQFGVTVTRDGGETFEQHLLGERVYDFAFADGNVYVAGENGLFITDDDGRTWRTVTRFADPAQPDRRLRPDVSVFSVATTDQALWVGTGEGLLRSTDNGLTWALHRVEVPLNPETPTEAVPRVETFAYPNPFSPSSDRFVRIRYELAQARTVRIRIFDFAMNLVREIDRQGTAGVRETIWDGLDDNGLRISNGTYFYAVEAGNDTFWGKILILE